MVVVGDAALREKLQEIDFGPMDVRTEGATSAT
jgi:hypothetical protein